MACDPCESAFQGAQSVVVSVSRFKDSALLYVENQGRNVVLIRRILLCYAREGTHGVMYLRPPPEKIAWSAPSAFLEQGTKRLFYTLAGLEPGHTVQAQAEYVEIDGRSRSCTESF